MTETEGADGRSAGAGSSGRAGGEHAASGLHPIVRDAGRKGRLPAWARCPEERREHVERVAGLLGGWAEELGLADDDVVRWKAAGILHDALRGAGPDELRFWTDRDWPLPLLHAPACAGRLREEGVDDGELLDAIAHHPIGRAGLGRIGRFLYLADFLEPGREFLEDVRERLRATLPEDEAEALLSVTALRVARRLEVRGRIRSDTVGMWNWLLETRAGDAEGRPSPSPGAPGVGP